MDRADIKEIVKEKYGQAALRGKSGSCCGTADATGTSCDPITSNLYDATQMQQVPGEALQASLGCGNPTALAKLDPGEVVLDLGSGGGIDVLLSAKRVGPTGKVYGLDMTDDMLDLANENKARAGATNVEFLRGHIESIPLPRHSVDVIISNCVINLSGDKRTVLAEAFRVLKPGGRFAVSDIVSRGELPEPVRRSMALWTGCVAGALDELEFVSLLRDVGFENASIATTRSCDPWQSALNGAAKASDAPSSRGRSRTRRRVGCTRSTCLRRRPSGISRASVSSRSAARTCPSLSGRPTSSGSPVPRRPS